MNYRKVNKSVARKLYDKGCTILLLPCKVNDSLVQDYPNQWIRPFSICMDTGYGVMNDALFDDIISNYMYYNCTIPELGYYPHYFVSEEEYNKHMNN